MNTSAHTNDTGKDYPRNSQKIHKLVSQKITKWCWNRNFNRHSQYAAWHLTYTRKVIVGFSATGRAWSRPIPPCLWISTVSKFPQIFNKRKWRTPFFNSSSVSFCSSFFFKLNCYVLILTRHTLNFPKWPPMVFRTSKGKAYSFSPICSNCHLSLSEKQELGAPFGFWLQNLTIFLCFLIIIQKGEVLTGWRWIAGHREFWTWN